MKWKPIAGLLMPLLAMAQLQVRDRTVGGELTGYYWMDLTKDGRIDFLFGFHAGYQAARPDANTPASEDWERNNPVPDGTYGDLVQALNTFFMDADNRPMPITAAMKLIKMKQEGKSQAEVDERLARYRSVFIAAPKEACASGRLSTEECRARGLAISTRPTGPAK